MVGVSSVAVSKWENGQSLPSKTAALRLAEVLSGMHEGKLAIELACIAPQLQVRSIVRGKNFQFMGASAGMKQLWPKTCAMVGQSLRDHFVNEAATYCEQGGYLHEAADGECLMVTAVSHRMLNTAEYVEPDHRLRWHAIVRRIDGELVHEVIYEPCAAGTPVGFERVLRRSDLAANYE
jgi:DNA-binding XRE family transcriptional regulator